MTTPTGYSYVRYLAAKKSVDDRALNHHVWQNLRASLPEASPADPARVLEVGAGIGTMVERLVAGGLLTHAIYTAMDGETDNITETRRRLPRWAADQGFSIVEKNPTQVRLQRGGQNVVVETEAIELFDFIAREQGQGAWDLLIAHAFLDLMDVPTTLPALFSVLHPGALFYFTINFDGATILQPEIDPALDVQIETLYHQTMDHRRVAGEPSGDSRTGRHLFGHLRATGAEVLDAGSSDWVVHAGPNGYAADEAYFLHFIIRTIHTALAGHPELDAQRFSTWIEQRHDQVEAGTLVYVAHQLDFLGRKR